MQNSYTMLMDQKMLNRTKTTSNYFIFSQDFVKISYPFSRICDPTKFLL